MKRILTGLLLGFMVLVAASRYSSAQTCCQGGGFREGGMPMHDCGGTMKRGHHLWRALMSLGLDEKQKEAIKEIKSRVMKDTVSKRADIEVARIDLRDILARDQVDMNAAETTLKKIASIQTDIRLSHIKAMQEIKTKLTPEQRKKFKEMREAGLKTESMMHGYRGMTPRTGNREGALQDKEQ
jgi:Spy/CpxP family protein refolding chaperone